MATLQTIRSKGPLVVIVVGVALLAFLAGDFFKIFQTHRGAANVGEVNGTSLSVMDFQNQVNNMSEMYKARTGRNLSDNEMAYVRDQVWNSFVMEELLKAETEKVGLTVTDAELQDVIDKGVNPMLSQAPIGVNPQTGRFDKDILKNFLVNYNTQLSQMDASTAQMYETAHNQWLNFEKELRLSLLAQKYQNLIGNAMLSNKVEAEYQYEGRVNQYDALFAAVPYRTIADSTVAVSDNDIKKLYDKYKDIRFKQNVEGRDIKYIQVNVVASEQDKSDLMAKMEESAKNLKSDIDNYSAFVKADGSTVEYVDMLRSKDAFPRDVTSRLDSVSVGQVVGPYVNVSDNSYNVFKLVAKANQADSVRFQNIVVARDTKEKTEALTDSIYNAIKGGADFKALAEKYNGAMEPQWVYSAQFNAGVDAQNAKYFSELFAADKDALYKTQMGDMMVITQVLDKKGSKEKYNVVVVKCPVVFSDATYSNEYNKFSQFVASNQTVENMTNNAEAAGYRVQEIKDMLSNSYGVANVQNTREALRWAFNAKVGEVSQVFECGDNNTLMVLAVTGKHDKGYLDFNSVKDQLKPEAIKDKKAEMIISDLKSKNLADINAYKSLDNVVSDTLKHITFSAPVSVMRVGGGEYVLSGLAAKAELNKLTAPVKGNSAVYVLDVFSTNKSNETFDLNKETQIWSSTYMRSASGITGDLFDKAEVEDNRYLFF